MSRILLHFLNFLFELLFNRFQHFLYFLLKHMHFILYFVYTLMGIVTTHHRNCAAGEFLVIMCKLQWCCSRAPNNHNTSTQYNQNPSHFN